jgi:hypothetical protein
MAEVKVRQEQIDKLRLSKVKPRARRPLFTAISLSPVWMR